MGATYDFDTVVDRRGTWCVQWDGVADRFGVDGLLPFTISDMDFATAPEVLAALRARLEHGVLGYTTWQQDDFRSAIAHWYATRYDTTIDTGQLVYGPSVLNQLSQLLRMWTEEGTASSSTPPRTTASARRSPDSGASCGGSGGGRGGAGA